MQNIYDNTRLLDKRAIDKFLLSEEILVENASRGLYNKIQFLTHKKSVIYIICGGGGNGADGLALARKLEGDYVVRVYMASEPKNALCEREFFRCKALKIDFVHKLYPCDVVVDCLYGSGFKGELSPQDQELVTSMNKMARIRIACDVPSGIMQKFPSVAFRADFTLVMGALKKDLFQEWAKDYVGEISVVDLGIARKHYEISSKIKLLEQSDLLLPQRTSQDTHKGEYGHLAILCKNHHSSQEGAVCLSALSAVAFGTGLVSLVGEVKNPPYSVMNTLEIPHNATAVALGMGAGEIEESDFCKWGDLPCVLDADVFAFPKLPHLLKTMQNVVLTPHIKEFAMFLKHCGLKEDLCVDEVKANRFAWVEEFCAMFPQVVLVLKGANTIIAQDQILLLSTLGKNNLAKGGSGDVLSGMIASLLAQGYDCLNASISGVLAHSLVSQKCQTSFGLDPLDLISKVKTL